VVEWFDGDLNEANTLKLPPFETLYCKADAVLLAKALPQNLRFQFDQHPHQNKQ
jgi:hypothetical protein